MGPAARRSRASGWAVENCSWRCTWVKAAATGTSRWFSPKKEAVGEKAEGTVSQNQTGLDGTRAVSEHLYPPVWYSCFPGIRFGGHI